MSYKLITHAFLFNISEVTAIILAYFITFDSKMKFLGIAIEAFGT